MIITNTFRIDQRNTSSVVYNTPTNSYDTVDRWISRGDVANVFEMQSNRDICARAGSLPGITSSIFISRTMTTINCSIG